MYTRAPGASRDKAGGERPLRHKIEHPWIYDTDNSTSDPPDINYKNLIRSDQKEIDDLLEDAAFAPDTNKAERQSLSKAKQDSAGAEHYYRLAFLFLLLLITYECVPQKIYP